MHDIREVIIFCAFCLKMRSQKSFLNKLRHVSPTPSLKAVYIGTATHFF